MTPTKPLRLPFNGELSEDERRMLNQGTFKEYTKPPKRKPRKRRQAHAMSQ